MIKRLLCSFLIVGSAHAMVFDNRFLPLFLKPYTLRCDAESHVRIQPFFMRADQAFSDERREEIPNIFGLYDQKQLSNAMVKAGFDQPLRSDFRLRASIPWNRQGRIDAQGIAFLWERFITPRCSVGVNTLFAHVSSRYEAMPGGQDDQALAGNKEYLFQAKAKMHDDIGLCPDLFSRTGIGDIDAFARFHWHWDYTLKFRRVDASLRTGVYIPSARARERDNPASIPLGGNRHWGLYGGIENEFEIKENLVGGYLFRAIKRFERTDSMRIPVDGEPENYGVITGPVRVDPGWTLVFNPYGYIAHLREGFGVKLWYTLVHHFEDTICDQRSAEAQRLLPSTFEAACTSWGSEYVSVGAFYDFGNIRWGCPLYPKFSAFWDIPVNWLVSKRAAETHSLSLMLEFDF